MHFQRLRLSGFKSFVDATEFRIEPGVTGIVGPNGCGKSNLLEALRWVMGANSAKAMRFSVMVPVLSVQITVAAPKVSTVVARFAMMPCRAKRQAPNARKVVKATGISSGRMDMARVRPERRLPEKEPVR